MEAIPKRRVLPQWLIESSANWQPPTKCSKMSREDQLFGLPREKRHLKDISNNANPKQRWLDSERKKAARAKESNLEQSKRLRYQNDYAKHKRSKETDEQKQSNVPESRKRSQLARQWETDQQYQAHLDDQSSGMICKRDWETIPSSSRWS